MMNLVVLKKAQAAILADPDLRMTEAGTTFCNFGVWAVAAALACAELTNKTANEIIDHVANDKRWLKVEGSQATDFALRGGLALAGQKADVHGHVATVCPEEMQTSASLAKKVPILANIGKRNARMKSSEAFPVSKGEASYWIWVNA